MNSAALRTASLLATALFIAGPAGAGDGHDHGDAPPAASGPALPRFAAVSETLELVGVLDGRRLTLYLDRYADNAPVPDAKVELDIAGTKVVAEPHEGAYELTLAEAPKPGVLPITATVTIGKEADLLAGELDLHAAAPADAPAASPWRACAPWIAGGLVVLAALGVALHRRHVRALRTGAAA